MFDAIELLAEFRAVNHAPHKHVHRIEDCPMPLCRDATAAIAQLRRAMWQPIETAPKDGTRVLVYWPSEDGQFYFVHPAAYEGDRWDDLGEGFELHPTHWMPMLSPPRSES